MRAAGHDLGYDVFDLAPATPSLLHDGLPLDWVPARSLGNGAPSLLPAATVRLSLDQPHDWSAPAFFASTNGLASGNTKVEATLHALYEVIERDAVTAAVTARKTGPRVDPHTLGSPAVDGLCDAIDRAGAFLEVRHVPSPTGLPCFLASIADPDYRAAMFGFGCHLSAEIALTRAITEAAQTRLGYISGARDDLRDDVTGAEPTRASAQPPAADIRDFVPPAADRASLLDDLQEVATRAATAFAAVPLVADLTRAEIGVPVVKVVVPGARICPEVL